VLARSFLWYAGLLCPIVSCFRVVTEIPCWTSKLDRWIDVNVLRCKCSLGYLSCSGCSLRYISWLQNVSSTSSPVILVKSIFSICKFALGNVCVIFVAYVSFSLGGYSLNTRKTLRDSRFKASVSGDHALPVIFPEYSVGGSRRVRGGHSVSPINVIVTLRDLMTYRAAAWVRNIGTRC
jgi:hypothetical protein